MDIRYVAGVVDSEGNFEINLTHWENKNGEQKARTNACLRVGMNCLETVEFVQSEMGMGKIYHSTYKNSKGTQNFHTLILTEKETEEMVYKLDGELITKRRDLNIMKDFFAGNKKEAFLKMKTIKRGTKQKKLVKLVA